MEGLEAGRKTRELPEPTEGVICLAAWLRVRGLGFRGVGLGFRVVTRRVQSIVGVWDLRMRDSRIPGVGIGM